MPWHGCGDDSQCYNSDTPDESTDMGREDFGYISLGRIILDESEMGDHTGHPDDWRGFHSFSNI
jgi:hypothetical protein